MIKITTETGFTHVVTPTIFPDGTSQVWKLPAAMFEARDLEITWNFDSEREIIDLLSLRRLLVSQTWTLHIPFLPYARQDKNIDNTSTFNLVVIADLINSLGCQKVTAVDVHNPMWTAELIRNFENVEVGAIHEHVARRRDTHFIVWPDEGAADRYAKSAPNAAFVVCAKVRDQSTGAITGHKILHTTQHNSLPPHNFLIVDDICDGGATFVSVAKLIRQEYGLEVNKLDLFVTHGIFSKGQQHLLDNGITNVFTTNSLTKNGDGYQV
jgi:ribose-phosphate pyrophosphokinase